MPGPNSKNESSDLLMDERVVQEAIAKMASGDLVVDISDVTRGDMDAYIQVGKGRREMYKQVTLRAPEEWGDVGRKSLPLPWAMQLRAAISKAFLDAKPEWVNVKFDLFQLTEDDLVDMAEWDNQVEILTRCVEKCPKGWGDPADEATWMNMKHADFLAVIAQLTEAISDLKN